MLVNVPEPEGDTAQQKQDFDFRFVSELFSDLGQAFHNTATTVYRLPVANGKAWSNLIKVVLPTSLAQQNLLRSAKQLKTFSKVAYTSLFVRPSLTVFERQKAFVLREQRRRLTKSTGSRYRIEKDSLKAADGTYIPLDQVLLKDVMDKAMQLRKTRAAQKTSKTTVVSSGISSLNFANVSERRHRISSSIVSATTNNISAPAGNDSSHVNNQHVNTSASSPILSGVVPSPVVPASPTTSSGQSQTVVKN